MTEQDYQDLLVKHDRLTLEYETLKYSVLALLANDTEENREWCRVLALFGYFIKEDE